MIIFRYIAREISAAASVVTGVLVVIFMSNQLVRYMGRAAAGKLPGGILFRLMLIQIPHLVGMLLPLGLFLGILLAFGRFYADGEMTVLRASGMKPRTLLGIVMTVALVAMTLVSLSTLWLDPLILAHKNELLSLKGTSAELETVMPGGFHQTQNGKQVYYVEALSPNHRELLNIFVAEKSPSSSVDDNFTGQFSILTARKASQQLAVYGGNDYLVFNDGYRYSGTPGQRAFQRVKFREYGIRLDIPQMDTTKDQETMTTKELWSQRDNIKNISEIQWRLSIPLSGLILALVAIPLSRVKPRQGKYAQILPSLIVYVFYANLLLVSHNWLDAGSISPLIGMWWAHAGMLLVAAILFLHQRGWGSLFPMGRAQT